MFACARAVAMEDGAAEDVTGDEMTGWVAGAGERGQSGFERGGMASSDLRLAEAVRIENALRSSGIGSEA
jgi:hypothetical protein